jgi:hypothetical protein
VVEVRSPHVIRGSTIQSGVLRDMLNVALTQFTGERDEAASWAAILSPNDVVGLKFNRSGAEGLGTTPVMAETLVGSLVDSGWPRSQIVPIELSEGLHQRLGTTRPCEGWQADEVEIGGKRDRLAAVLNQVTAIVNVPFVKSHNLAGMTCCLKNLSHALVKHPAQFHNRQCEQVADIVALAQINSKVRLHLVDALRFVIHDGPEASPEWVVDASRLICGSDGPAVDTVALELINQFRSSAALDKIGGSKGHLAYLTAASRLRLGRNDLHEIDWIRTSI